MLTRLLKAFLILLFLANCVNVFGQTEIQSSDSARATIGEIITGDTLAVDSAQLVDNAALDIGLNRGLFITTPDGLMQMRILGSIRFLAVYDQYDLFTKNHLNSFEIPVPERQAIPNYYNSVNQSRLGFEVTRRLAEKTVFIRLETDFAGTNGAFRIRHAYGQVGKFLIGQTWSLFTHITALPAMVDFGGPTGSIAARTPQVRFRLPSVFDNNSVLSVALEYVTPEVTIPDSLFVSVQQLVPDLTASLTIPQNWGQVRVSAILPVITAQFQDDLFIGTGWGITASAIVNSWLNGKWYLWATGGKGISRFYNDLEGKGLDYFYNPTLQEGIFPHTGAFYVSYEHRWAEKWYSNFTAGSLFLEKSEVFIPSYYRSGHSFHFNTFWDIIDGARMGLEYANTERVNQNGESGNASRISVLFYYDF